LEVTEAEPLLRYILSGGERWKTIRDEKRHSAGQVGTRAHDPEHVHCTADAQGRLIMGKLVFDTMRGVDFLESLPWVDSDRMGVAGLSLGGAKAGWMLALDPRLKMALVAGWAFDDILLEYGDFCTRVPNQRLRALCEWTDYLALAAPHCAVLVLNGDAGVIIDCDGVVWRGLQGSLRVDPFTLGNTGLDSPTGSGIARNKCRPMVRRAGGRNRSVLRDTLTRPRCDDG
jgi:hypothetical protein